VHRKCTGDDEDRLSGRRSGDDSSVSHSESEGVFDDFASEPAGGNWLSDMLSPEALDAPDLAGSGHRDHGGRGATVAGKPTGGRSVGAALDEASSSRSRRAPKPQKAAEGPVALDANGRCGDCLNCHNRHWKQR